MTVKAGRKARAIVDDLKRHNDFTTTLKELGEVFEVKVTGETPLEGSSRTIMKKIIAHRSATEAVVASDDTATKAEAIADSLVKEIVGEASINSIGRPIKEILPLLSARFEQPITAAYALDALGMYGSDETSVESTLEQIEARLQESFNRTTATDTLGGLLQEYRDKGHIGLFVSTAHLMFGSRLPWIKEMEFDSVISEAQASELRGWLKITTAICVQMRLDVGLPAIGKPRVINPQAPVERQMFEYSARCGDSTQQSYTDATKRLENDNEKVGVFKELCDAHGEARAKLLMLPPDAAKADNLICVRCGGALFKTGVSGLTKSRIDLWMNGMRNVFSITNLLDRLVPRHRSTDPVCIENQRKVLQARHASEKEYMLECDSVIAHFNTSVMIAIQGNPEVKRQLIAQLPERIQKIRSEYGLPESDTAYQQKRIDLGIVSKPVKTIRKSQPRKVTP